MNEDTLLIFAEGPGSFSGGGEGKHRTNEHLLGSNDCDTREIFVRSYIFPYVIVSWGFRMHAICIEECKTGTHCMVVH